MLTVCLSSAPDSALQGEHGLHFADSPGICGGPGSADAVCCSHSRPTSKLPQQLLCGCVANSWCRWEPTCCLLGASAFSLPSKSRWKRTTLLLPSKKELEESDFRWKNMFFFSGWCYAVGVCWCTSVCLLDVPVLLLPPLSSCRVPDWCCWCRKLLWSLLLWQYSQPDDVQFPFPG